MHSEIQYTEAFILKQVSYSDTDQIFHFFTEDFGIVHALAKGAKVSKKRFAGILDFLTQIEIGILKRKNSDLFMVSDARLIDGFSNLRQHYERLWIGMAILELTQHFYREGEHHPEAFSLLVSAFQSLNSGVPEKEVFWNTLFEHLRILGVAPVLDWDLSVFQNGIRTFSIGLDEEKKLIDLFDAHLRDHLSFKFDWSRFLSI